MVYVATLLFDASLKSVAVLLIALFGISVVRLVGRGRANVHGEHRIWTFVLLSLLALPLIHNSATGFILPIAVLPKWEHQPDVELPLATDTKTLSTPFVLPDPLESIEQHSEAAF